MYQRTREWAAKKLNAFALRLHPPPEPSDFSLWPVKPEILVVEDEQDNAHLLEIYFRNQHADVTCISTMSAALELLNHRRFHIAILDLKLTNGSGLAVLKKIRDHARHTHIILHSGHPDLILSALAMKLYVGFLPKPWSGDMIRDILVKHRLHRPD